MRIEIEITNEQSYGSLVKRIGQQKVEDVFSNACDAVLSSMDTASLGTQKQRVYDIVKKMGNGSPKDFFNAYRDTYPNNNMAYTTLGVYLTNMISDGVVLKTSRGQYAYIGYRGATEPAPIPEPAHETPVEDIGSQLNDELTEEICDTIEVGGRKCTADYIVDHITMSDEQGITARIDTLVKHGIIKVQQSSLHGEAVIIYTIAV